MFDNLKSGHKKKRCTDAMRIYISFSNLYFDQTSHSLIINKLNTLFVNFSNFVEELNLLQILFDQNVLKDFGLF